MVLALGRQRQSELWEFKTNLLHRGTARAAQRHPVWKINKETS